MIQRLRKLFASGGGHDVPTPYQEMADLARSQSGGGGGSVSVTKETALQLATVFACVRNIAQDVGKIPLKVYRTDRDGSRFVARDHPLYSVLHLRPEPSTAIGRWLELLIFDYYFWGRFTAEIKTQPGQSAQLVRIDPERVEHRGGAIVIKPDYAAGDYEERLLDPSEVIEITSLDGESIVDRARRSFGLSLDQEQMARAFYGNNARPGGFISHPQVLSDTAREHLRASFRSHAQGKHAFGLLILEEGMKYEQGTMPLTDAQFLESRRFEREEIARWFRVPPHKVGILDKATFSNIEHQNLEYYQDTLMPLQRMIEAELNYKLLPEQDAFAEFEYRAIMMADHAARQSYYSAMLQNGVLSINEVRALENFNPVEGGDVPHYQVNMQPVGAPAPAPPAATAARPSSAPLAPVARDIAARITRRRENAVASAMGRKGQDAEGFEAWLMHFAKAEIDRIASDVQPFVEASTALGYSCANPEYIAGRIIEQAAPISKWSALFGAKPSELKHASAEHEVSALAILFEALEYDQPS